ncbi:hypothetical protein ASPWEDRAFT_115815 [Aspergillus wentii DTO 134E9]|uniref:trans-L-3-hydroxyproline dehydratase n=1 Tax=Aspergillus wentii DTO 134E9 TaxID=1073089 RepID=A0A1L9RD30_ASPWE|nr:uncharacterized protein ASPWEDRAFT_115815 [Aspergillus wentii DTO 134E9]KAI9933041.1 Trans-L-3-hydroxyproline dehydratase [Aspergillus wentii]OJJ32763.1 hypothetical protein ASPWEDRAFT_115815 [Aspergillus wentii DTO 134E9]
MDIAESLENATHTEAIRCVDMHTTGEPTRIVYSGFPPLYGTLLEQRDQATQKYDHIRKRVMLEPRGHDGMYGAIIRPKTELVQSGDAHVGTLFIHNEGFSTMCGHATIGLGRFFVDTHDPNVFPYRDQLKLDVATQTVNVNIHAPCGLIRVTVPTTADGRKSDPSRPVTFLSTPAFATAIQVRIPIPHEIRWPALGSNKQSITLDVSYGGAFYAIVDAKELGFLSGLNNVDLDVMTSCAQKLKPYLMTRPEIISAVQHPEDKRLSFLYSVMVVDSEIGSKPNNVTGAETGLCYFAESQIDRSPTGSCVTARMALAHAKGLRPAGQRWAYNSLVSNHFGEGSFSAEIVEDLKDSVVVQVEGQAFYTGTSIFVVEEGDATSSSGFTMKDVV